MSSWLLLVQDKTDEGTSIIEGTKESLERMGLEYVDVVFAHRCDNTSMYLNLVLSVSINDTDMATLNESSHGGNCPRVQLGN